MPTTRIPSRRTSVAAIRPSAANVRTSGPNVILILSGYLLGTTAAHICSPMMERCAMSAGAIGIIGYAVVSWMSRQRRAEHNRRAVQTAAVKLEHRVERHVRRASAALLLRLHTSRPRLLEQYVTVVQSTR